MKIDKTSLNEAEPSQRPPGPAPRRPAWQQPPSLIALATLLLVALGAGALIESSLSSSSPLPALPTPLPPTPLVPSPTPAPTPTATLPEAGDLLETLYIEIAPPEYAQIVAKREEALRLGILLATDDDYVRATMRFRHDEIPVELRLKGDWIDHYAYDKWSFRVRTRQNNYLLGMQTFSVQDLARRTFLNEWLFMESLRLEGVLSVPYYFVRVVLNGEYKGIYAIEGGFDKELLESQQRREGLIIRYDEDLVWEYRAFYNRQFTPRGVNLFYIIDDFESARIAADPNLSAQRDTAIGLLRGLWTGERSAAEVFDLDTMGKFFALTDLWNAQHCILWHNLRYYYNPITTHLEPIAFDCAPLSPELNPEKVGLQPETFYHDPRLQAAYLEALDEITQPGYVEALEAQLGARFETLRGDLIPEFGEQALTPPWNALRRRHELLGQMLDPPQMVYAYVQRPAPESWTAIDVGNLLDLPVELIALEVNGERLPISPDWVAPESASLLATAPGALVLRPLAPDATFMNYVRLQIPQAALPGLETAAPKIVTRLWGLNVEHREPVLPGYPLPLAQGPLPELPSVAQALEQHPYLQPVNGQDMLRIASGTWEIQGNLVLPAGYGLRLEPGVTLRFGRDNYLLSSGGPLDFQGTSDAPIELLPSGEQWQGVVVLQADALSVWNYVTVESTSAIDQGGWTLTGGVTFYASPLRLDHCRILNSRAEDSLNVIRSRFEFIHSEFGGSVSDAFDADFGQGSITDSSFHDTGGDGIDVSGSDVRVQGVTLLNIADKALSVGEASRLEAASVHFENVGFALVSKDLSHATLQDATIENVQLAALAAYIKKPSYGPASLDARGINFIDVPPERRTLVQTGSWIDLEGVRTWGVDVDVDALYPQ